MGRKVCIKMIEGRHVFALHDAETGECFDDQCSVEILNGDAHSGDLPTAVVTFQFTEDFFRESADTPEQLKKKLDALNRP